MKVYIITISIYYGSKKFVVLTLRVRFLYGIILRVDDFGPDDCLEGEGMKHVDRKIGDLTISFFSYAP